MLELITFVLIICFSYLLLNLIIRDMRFLEKLALSYLLGLGLTTVLMFFYSWAGIKITILSLISLLVILIACLSLTSKILKRKINFDGINLLKKFREFRWYEKILCFIICFLFSSSIILSVFYPVIVWDALALYDFRARIIVETGYFVQIASRFEYFPYYPLLTTLQHVIVYLSKGTNPQYTYSLYYFAFAILCFSFIRRYCNRFIALLFTSILIADPTLFAHSTIAYTNLPYTVFYVMGILYLFYALTKDRYDYLFVSSLLIGLSTWARSHEPFWVAEIAIVIIYSLYKRKIYPLIVYLPAFLIIQQGWEICQRKLLGSIFYGTSNQYASMGGTLLRGINISRIIEVLNYIYQNVILSWSFVFPLLIAAIFINIKNKKSKDAFILLVIIIVNFMVLFLGTYYFTLTYRDWKEIANSAVRMSMFFPPLIICYSGIVIANIFRIVNKIKE